MAPSEHAAVSSPQFYTPAEKERIERILSAFQPYLCANGKFEILYTKTLGYISLTYDAVGQEGFFRMLSADSVVLELFDHIVRDIMYVPGHRDHPDNRPFPDEECRARRQIFSYVQTLAEEADRAYCLRLWDRFLAEWP